VKDEDKKRNEETTGRNIRGWGRFCLYKIVLPQGGESVLQGRNTRLLLLRSLDEKSYEIAITSIKPPLFPFTLSLSSLSFPLPFISFIQIFFISFILTVCLQKRYTFSGGTRREGISL
jgi:hypothetical protein